MSTQHALLVTQVVVDPTATPRNSSLPVMYSGDE